MLVVYDRTKTKYDDLKRKCLRHGGRKQMQYEIPIVWMPLNFNSNAFFTQIKSRCFI